ncbi:hypothetical protein [Paenibacillus hexagrammi]|uniref:Uncharacterized protein n=1 Tax=Paenibacillus hexagrammi TaxID=2908839 RepID=A0ABY3SKM1_9BACL|nr:hypothetical protein [Paenibacillus sp. YPD9-1]UJF33741.1 hypothetical protein L0M14_00275 [Paenibacillus sp. YPD9-1]
MSDGKFISEAELEDSKKALGMDDNKYDYFVLNFLQNKHTKGGDRAISSRISPIADKEVIASKTFWEIAEYAEEATLMAASEKCYHITFDETEYCQLIFSYFKAYHKNKNQGRACFEERYASILAREKESIKNNIDKLEQEQRLLNKDDAQHKDEDKESIQEKLNVNSLLINFYHSYKDFLDNEVINETNAKVQFALSFVDWSTDEIPERWSLNNMYTVKEHQEKNLKVNLYKCLCKSAASV